MNNHKIIIWSICAALAISGLWIGYVGINLYQQANIIIEWSTASELETVGFHVLRGEKHDGPYERITEVIIPASSDPLLENDYSFTDTDVIIGITYYYILEDIDTGGDVNRHGPLEIIAERGGRNEIMLSGLFLLSAMLLTVFNQVRSSKLENSDDQSID